MVYARPPVNCLAKRVRLSPLVLADLPDLARLLARAGFTIDDRRAGLEVRPGVLRDCVWLSIAPGDREDRA